jgi:structural hemagglutinin/hemolysin toxin protein RtxA
MYKLIFYVPIDWVEQVKEAVFEAGAGSYGNYDRCSWQVLGEGQFRPLAGSKPFIGNINTLEVVPEYRVETLVKENNIKSVLAALINAHPYETPAYDVMVCVSL